MICQKNMHGVGVLAPAPCVDDILTVALTSVEALRADRIPVVNRSKELGGAGARMCFALDQKLSGRPAALFPVPIGPFGDSVILKFRARGTCVSHIKRYTGKPQCNIVVEYADGKRSIYRGQTSTDSGSRDYQLSAVSTCGCLLVAGSVSPIAVGKAVKAANRSGIPWAWNPSERHFTLLRQGMAESASIIQMNDNEAIRFSGMSMDVSTKNVAKAVREMTGAKIVIVTCGAKGAHGTNGDHRGVFHHPAPSLNGRKTVGLGDRHFALVNWAFRLGADLPEALKFAADNL